ncbi:hypothetical protein BH23ACI1_BH23ACI1_16150 [soil metagenome]|nr:gas vesicle protein K [Acidobacteriota bacterium]
MKKPNTRRKRPAASAAKQKRLARPRVEHSGEPTVAGLDVKELESLRAEIERLGASGSPRWNADPEDVKRSVGKLVLTLVEFIRQLLERQAIRRMEAGTLTPDQTEAVGLALMRLEETIRDLAASFGVDPDDLNLDLGPVGRLM